MARADRAEIDSGTPAEVLMDRAGRAVARAVIELARGRYGKKVAVVCGKGSNGGDGFVIARVLAGAGMKVRCFLLFDPSEARGAAAHHLDLLASAGIRPEAFAEDHLRRGAYDVVVDALFGTGFKGSIDGAAARAVDAINRFDNVVAVDIPSGVTGTTGAVHGPAVTARVTVTMAAEKIGTALPPGSVHAGRVEVADIGIPVTDERIGARDVRVALAEASDVRALLPHRDPSAHKRSAGAVMIVAGSDEMRGAALLTAEGAYRAGAGYVTLGSTPSVKGAAASSLPELLCRAATKTSILGPDVLDVMSDVVARADAVAIGPGIGTGGDQRALVERVLAEVDIPVVLDADALNVLANDPSPLRSRGAPAVITPHPAELGRLLGSSTKDVVSDRLGAARMAAGRFPAAAVLVKGHRTIVAHDSGRAAVVIPVGGPELATAGTGDVLTGAIAALVAAGLAPPDAAVCGAYVHGLAGSVAGSEVGARGVIAGDVAEALPEAFALISGL